MKKIILKRIYDEPSEDDGYRILIDRLWPRGISKENAKLDEWDKEMAPSTELRKWFNHEPEKFQEFSDRYKVELKSHTDELKRLAELSQKQQLCILFGAKDQRYNQAVVLKSVLEG
jgi:uncharacterized protein YeaO (DUF488 family)